LQEFLLTDDDWILFSQANVCSLKVMKIHIKVFYFFIYLLSILERYYLALARVDEFAAIFI